MIIENTNAKTMQDKFPLKIGGQVHVKCEEHCISLPSIDRKNKYARGKKYNYR